MKAYTEFELLQDVGNNYKGFLDISKALKIFEIENGYIPEIIEDTTYVNISDYGIEQYNLKNDTNITAEQMHFMKMLQESGEVNMFMSSNIIQQRLYVDRREAQVILKAYATNYTEIFCSHNLI